MRNAAPTPTSSLRNATGGKRRQSVSRVYLDRHLVVSRNTNSVFRVSFGRGEDIISIWSITAALLLKCGGKKNKKKNPTFKNSCFPSSRQWCSRSIKTRASENLEPCTTTMDPIIMAMDITVTLGFFIIDFFKVFLFWGRMIV